MKRAQIRLLLWEITLLSPSRTWLATANQNDSGKSVLSTSLTGHPSNSDDQRRNGYNLYDPSQPQSGGGGGSIDAWDDFLTNGREPRRNREPVPVNYMGRHPFEKSTKDDDDGIQNQNARQAQSIPATVNNDTSSYYKPIRVHFDTRLLDSLSTTYPIHVSYLRDVLFPHLRSFWSEALSVVPAEKIEVPLSGYTWASRCAEEIKFLTGLDLGQNVTNSDTTSSTIATEGNVEMSSDGNSLIYNEVDLVVVVVPMEGTFMCPAGVGADTKSSTLAFATNCQHDQLDRPTVGYTGICFGPLDPENNSTIANTRRFLTMAHELTHVLGMNSNDIPFFYSHATEKPRTPRDQWNRPPISQNVPCVDGTIKNDVTTASDNTMKQVTTANGQIAYEIATETVANVVRNQFNCQRLTGARLENQPTAENDCFGSHWDQRLFNNEFMAAVNTGSTQYISALTLAFLEDSGWYRPNYAVAQNSPFGLGAGCEFVEDQCIQNGTVPEWAEGTFCSSAASVGCTSDKHLVAYCDIAQWDENLPAAYQYFEDPFIGSVLQQRDFCPAYSVTFRFESGNDVPRLDCTDATLRGAWLQKKGEVFGEASRCIDVNDGDRPICLEVKCGEYGGSEDAGKVVLVVEGESLRCSYAGEKLQLPNGDTEVTCPTFEQTCPDSLCPANCAGRGICDFSLSPPMCECFGRNDASPFCSESPSSFASRISPAPTQKRVVSSAAPTGLPSSTAPTAAPTGAVSSSSAPTSVTTFSVNLPASPTKSSADGGSPFQPNDPFSASPNTLQSNDFVSASPIHISSDSPTVAPGTDSLTGATVLQPIAAKDDPIFVTSAPVSGSFHPGSAVSLFLVVTGTWWLVN